MSTNTTFKLWPFVLLMLYSTAMLHNKTSSLGLYLLECCCFGPVTWLQLQTAPFAFWWNSFSLCWYCCPRACYKMSCCQLYFQCHIITSLVPIVAHNLQRNWTHLLSRQLTAAKYEHSVIVLILNHLCFKVVFVRLKWMNCLIKWIKSHVKCTNGCRIEQSQ